MEADRIRDLRDRSLGIAQEGLGALQSQDVAIFGGSCAEGALKKAANVSVSKSQGFELVLNADIGR